MPNTPSDSQHKHTYQPSRRKSFILITAYFSKQNFNNNNFGSIEIERTGVIFQHYLNSLRKAISHEVNMVLEDIEMAETHKEGAYVKMTYIYSRKNNWTKPLKNE